MTDGEAVNQEQRVNDEEEIYRDEPIDEDQYLRRMQNIYSKFQDDNGNISVDNLLKVLQALGYNPSSKDCQQRLEDFSLEGKNDLSFEDVLMVCQESWVSVNNRDALLAAFKIFDKEKNGYIDSDEFRKLMTTLGEPLSDEEIDDLIKLPNILNNDGEININELADKLLNDIFADDIDHNSTLNNDDHIKEIEEVNDQNKENI